MNQGASVTLVGFVATEPKLRAAGNGIPVANMRIGSTDRKIDKDTGEWKDGETNFYSVSCWRALASNSAMCLHKGQRVVVTGKLRVNQWQDRAGQQRREVEVQAETIGLDLNRGVAQFTPRRRSPDDGLNLGEAIRAGLAEAPLADLDGLGQSNDDSEGGMFDEHAIAELDQELDASAAEPAAN